MFVCMFINMNIYTGTYKVYLFPQSACEAEYEDNAAEQRRQNGKLLRYGQIIQVSSLSLSSSTS